MRHEPLPIPHGEPGAGLRDWLPIAAAPPRPRARRWVLVLLLIFLFGVLCGRTTASAAPPCVTLQVRPAIVLPMTRVDVRLELRIPRHADHRAYSVAWTSDVGSEGSLARQLEGDASEVLHTHLLRGQPAANYQFVAAVYDARGRAVGRHTAEIRSPDPDR